jgi:transmembrane sensor
VTKSRDSLTDEEILAEASLWVTYLHEDDHGPELVARVNRWLAESRRHRDAFNKVTKSWQLSGHPITEKHLAARSSYLTPAWNGFRSRYALWGAAAIVVVSAVVFYCLNDPSLSTGFAEQKIVDLADGTQMTLNANSRVVVEYTDRLRKLTLAKGEVMFNVAHEPQRPFEVIIGDRKVIALGTSFQVRRDDSRAEAFTVTLIEGRVAIEPLSGPDALPVAAELPPSFERDRTLLKAGQRLRFTKNSADTIDTPQLERVTAWQHGQLIFDNTSIRDAANEFNRYAKRKLIIDPTVSDAIHVGGVFRIGDPDSFARAMADGHQLLVTEKPEEIIISAP